MKCIRFLFLLPLIIFTSFFFFSGSCDSESMPNSYITFTLDGQSNSFELGLSDIESEAFGNIASGNTILLAAGDDTGTSTIPPDNCVYIRILSTNPGTYTSAFDSILVFYYWENGTLYYPVTPLVDQTTTVTVDTIDAVSGSIEGTFTAYLHSGSGTIEKMLTGGIIKLKCINDESFYQWP